MYCFHSSVTLLSVLLPLAQSPSPSSSITAPRRTKPHPIHQQCPLKTSSDTTSPRSTRRWAYSSILHYSLLNLANLISPSPTFVFSQLSKYPALQRAEARTGIPKAYGVLGGAGLFSVFIFFNLAAGFLTTLLGWALPAYFSLKALETPSQGDDTQWLTYWTVFGAFQIVEYFSDMILYW